MTNNSQYPETSPTLREIAFARIAAAFEKFYETLSNKNAAVGSEPETALTIAEAVSKEEDKK